MDNLPQNPNPENCIQHNQPIIIYNSDPTIGARCLICLQQQPGSISVEQFIKQQKEIYEGAFEEIDFGYQKYKYLLENLLNYKQNIIISLDKIIQIIIDQVKIVDESKKYLNSVIISNISQKDRISQIQETLSKQKEKNRQIIDSISQQLNDFSQKYQNTEALMTICSKRINCETNEDQMQRDIVNKKKIIIQEVKAEDIKQQQKQQYELIQNQNTKQTFHCLVFVFNQDNTILVVGLLLGEIALYEFNEGIISKELQRMNNHTDNVNYLYFMNQSNSFVSGSKDKTIIIWVPDEHNKWIAQNKLYVHCKSIECVLMNKTEDLMISGGQDCPIKFWGKKSKGWECLESIQTEYKVLSMCLNQRDDKLIVCENNFGQQTKLSCIQILHQFSSKKWNIVQTINFKEHGWRLCFTIDDQFVFTTQNSNQLDIYDYDFSWQQFQKIKSVKMKPQGQCWSMFPCQFIKPLNILTFKNGKFLNIIKINNKTDYEILQEIEFGSDVLRGCMSNDGENLITWDKSQEVILVRRLKEKN